MPNRKIISSIGLLDLVLSSPAATESLGKTIGQRVQGGEVLALIGELGAGKTALIRGIAAGLEAPPALVSSPTFVLIHEYQGRLPLIHVDLYRLQSQANAEAIGLEDYFTDQAVVAIEWADRFPTLLPGDRLEVCLTHRSRSTRTARLIALGPQSNILLTKVAELHRASRRSQRSPQSTRSSRRKALKR